jgi:prolyl-tRNA editing enzyme YbaK/EbsC (Cys-tRNA(Pro) deacylase)
MTQKTNAARLLDQMGIRYELREYEVDPHDLAAEAVATKIGLPPAQLFKTLVATAHETLRRGWVAVCALLCILIPLLLFTF